jgi:hypothetical protein
MVGASSTDASGNTGTCSFTVQVEDTTAPVIACFVPAASMERTGYYQAVGTFDDQVATDTCGDSPTLFSSHASGDSLPLHTTTVYTNATDGSDNIGNCSFGLECVDTVVFDERWSENRNVRPTLISPRSEFLFAQRKRLSTRATTFFRPAEEVVYQPQLVHRKDHVGDTPCSRLPSRTPPQPMPMFHTHPARRGKYATNHVFPSPSAPSLLLPGVTIT